VNAVVREAVEMLTYRNLFRDVEVRLDLGETPGRDPRDRFARCC